MLCHKFFVTDRKPIVMGNALINPIYQMDKKHVNL